MLIAIIILFIYIINKYIRKIERCWIKENKNKKQMDKNYKGVHINLNFAIFMIIMWVFIVLLVGMSILWSYLWLVMMMLLLQFYIYISNMWTAIIKIEKVKTKLTFIIAIFWWICVSVLLSSRIISSKHRYSNKSMYLGKTKKK